MARPNRLRTPAPHPSQNPAGAALVARTEALPSELAAATWERVVRAALTGRSRAAAAELLGEDVRTVQRWRAWLDANGGAPVGAWSRAARGAGARGGSSPATERARRAGVNHSNTVT
jgi:hypothetical protein